MFKKKKTRIKREFKKIFSHSLFFNLDQSSFIGSFQQLVGNLICEFEGLKQRAKNKDGFATSSAGPL